MLTQLSRSVRSSSTIRIWRLALVSGLRARGSVAVADTPGGVELRSAVIPTSRPDTCSPARKLAPARPAAPAGCRVRCTDQADWPDPRAPRGDPIYLALDRVSRRVVALLQH